MKIALIEDEAQVAHRIARLTRLILADRIISLDTYSSVEKARAGLSAAPVDLVLLDLNLNGRDGFELLVPFVAERFQTIVVSAHKDQALRAFEFGILDFVPKPVEQDRLKAALDRFDGIRREPRPVARRLAVRSHGRIELLAVDDVVRISGAADYAELHLRSGKTHFHDKTLDALSTLLGVEFRRIHRSHLVRPADIRKLISAEGSRYSLELANGVILPVSRSRIAALREDLSL